VEAQNSWWALLDWFTLADVANWASIVGIFITLVGFGFTIRNTLKSKTAAERAELAARQTRESIHLFETVVDFSAAISVLEEIKRLHRLEQWILLPDRYTALRRHLISIRASAPGLTDAHAVALQTALTNVQSIERAVERAHRNPDSLNAAKFNAALSVDLDNLITALTELKARGGK
jgi:hypothetical protein